MPHRKKWMFSGAPIPERTMRRKRRCTRMTASAWAYARMQNLSLRAGAEASTSFASGDDVNLTPDNVNNLGADFDLPSASIDRRSTDTSEGTSTGDEDRCDESDSDDVSSPNTCDGTDNGQENVSPSAENINSIYEETLPEPDDFQFWDGQAGHDIYLNTPLCPFLDSTRGDALVMCLALGLRHSMPWTAIVDMLQMINCLFGQEVVKATKYFFCKYMEAGKGKVTYHWYCHYCHRFLGSKQELSDVIGPCRCGKTADEVKKAKTFFITLSLEEQLQDLLKNKEFVEALRHRFERQKKEPDALEDIYDGELYSALSEPGEVLSYWYNMSYTFNSDGFPVGGKSGKQTCWPIYLQINELPHKMRSKYMLLAGMYVGSNDPNMQLYMYPFVEEANDLATVGVNWQLNNRKMNSKVIPLCACVDTPARSKILNMTAFSGFYGCTICPNDPESTPSGKRYTLPINAMLERTHREILVDAAHAHANKTLYRDRQKWRVKGVKGPTPLHNLKYLDLVKGVRPDIMHSIMLGNGRHHFQILHDSVGHPYYIGADVRLAAISKRLLAIKPPSSLPRSPRDVERYCSWKANEWLAWILFYVVPCLYDIIPHEYVNHVSLLSSSLHIMMKKSITRTELETAHVLALRYVYLVQQYFGKQEMVMNIHLLMHMRQSILYLGPAWTHMAFSFEGANKSLLDLKKGTSSIAQEIVSKYLTFKALPFLCGTYCSSKETLEFCQNLSGRPLLKSFLRVGKVILVGKGTVETLNPEEMECLSSRVFLRHKEILAFEKFIMDDIRYSSNSYSHSKKTDDSYISVSGGTKARIHKIIQFLGGEERQIFVLVRELQLDQTPLFNDEFSQSSPLQRVLRDGEMIAIKPEDISAQCVAMFLESGNFICEVPYGCYGFS